MQELAIDLANPGNQGVDFTGCIPGKPAKDTETNKWGHVILAPSAVVNGTLVSNRVAIVTSTGIATPATVTGFVRQSTNGNYIFSVQRDKLDAKVQEVRKAINLANKADYLANGPKVRPAVAEAATVAIPGQTQAVASTPAVTGKPVTTTQTGLTTEQITYLQSLGLTVGQIAKGGPLVIAALATMASDQASDTVVVAQASAPQVSIPTSTPKGKKLAPKS